MDDQKKLRTSVEVLRDQVEVLESVNKSLESNSAELAVAEQIRHNVETICGIVNTVEMYSLA